MYAFPATTAMRNPRKFVIIANLAPPLRHPVRIVEELAILFLNEGHSPQTRHIILDADGLEIAPKTQEHIQIGEQTHVERFPIV
jgi:hypothetical protein